MWNQPGSFAGIPQAISAVNLPGIFGRLLRTITEEIPAEIVWVPEKILVGISKRILAGIFASISEEISKSLETSQEKSLEEFLYESFEE